VIPTTASQATVCERAVPELRPIPATVCERAVPELRPIPATVCEKAVPELRPIPATVCENTVPELRPIPATVRHNRLSGGSCSYINFQLSLTETWQDLYTPTHCSLKVCGYIECSFYDIPV
jgi:hypothetical protein